MTFSLRRPSFKQVQLAFLILFIVGTVGAIIIVKKETDNRSRASTDPSQEVENGLVSGTATVGTDATASGGKYITFGGVSSATIPTATPTPPSGVPMRTSLLGMATEGSANDSQKNIMENYGVTWLTPENSMKMQSVDGCNGTYNFGWGDSLVAYAQAHGMKVHGHTVVWHSQTSSCANSYTQQQFINYIKTVISHYCGQVYSFDVLNEAIDDGGGLRGTIWRSKFGDGYIETAYRAAREACPSMKLYYNDYNIEGGGKFNEAMDLIVTPLKNKGLIDGVGFQTHVDTGGIGGLSGAMDRVKALGLEAAVSEMDVAFSRDYTVLSPADYTQQASVFNQAATICKNHSNCVRFTVWGVDDGHSWLNSTDVGQGIHNDAPLLFNRSYQPKPAYCTGIQPVLGTPRGAC